jgi:hypothetical protein
MQVEELAGLLHKADPQIDIAALKLQGGRQEVAAAIREILSPAIDAETIRFWDIIAVLEEHNGVPIAERHASLVRKTKIERALRDVADKVWRTVDCQDDEGNDLDDETYRQRVREARLTASIAKLKELGVLDENGKPIKGQEIFLPKNFNI